MNYETRLFEVAPWSQEVMIFVKTLNNGNFLRTRTGWERRNIEMPESIYDHCYKVGLASHYLFGTIDAIAQGVVHDFPEILRPDHIPWEVEENEKRRSEFSAMLELKDLLPSGSYYFKMWENFESRKGISKQIFELDKICPCIQAIEYQRKYKNHNLEEFYLYAKKKIQTPQLVELLDVMMEVNLDESVNPYDVYFNKLKNINPNNLQ